MLAAQIIDEAMFLAGRRMQELYESAEIGKIPLVDPGRVYVDGGKPADPLTDTRLRAVKEIERVEQSLGEQGASLIRDVLYLGLTIKRSAAARGLTQRKYVLMSG